MEGNFMFLGGLFITLFFGNKKFLVFFISNESKNQRQ